MSRYQPLSDFLTAQKSGQWDASFAEIEALLGFALPPSAYKYRAWWANQNGEGHSQKLGWRSAGWRTAQLDLERRRVTFKREGEDRQYTLDLNAVGDDLIRQASELTGIRDRDELVREALRALIVREAGRRLIRLGGTMPDLKAPPTI